ncbi:transcriptional enhancer factor TEF-1-like isoform X2 [Babylonia areolata]|uniref:transcriptional enhancer factor TEF-1-like isoform X2 n=1 Tax=Babylonia areolata TaxID=304850 RepID=UPI003FD17573
MDMVSGQSDMPPAWSGNGEGPQPPPTTDSMGSDDKNDGCDDLSDAEGVWSPDIEQSFQEALAIYPPCGRRKIILSDEGKMYGRNELIARYIKLRTGKTRTRKQVSSHIQVLARRKAKEIQSQLKTNLQDQAARDKALQQMASMSSAQIVSASAIHNKAMGQGLPGLPPGVPPSSVRPPYPGAPSIWQPGLGQGDVKPFGGSYGFDSKLGSSVPGGDMGPAWQGRSIAGPKLRMVEFSAFLEQQRDHDSYHKHLFVHIGANATYSDPMLEAVDIRQIYDKFPEKKGGLKELYDKGPQSSFFLVKFWADINTNVQDETGAFYGVTSHYESSENMTIQVSTKVCSFGKQVVEKVETEYPRFENGRFMYRIHRSPMCEYMINFIHKLKHLPEKYMMNSVLENFTILQVVTNRDTQETLLCIAYVFEVSSSEHGAQHHIYKLVKD